MDDDLRKILDEMSHTLTLSVKIGMILDGENYEVITASLKAALVGYIASHAEDKKKELLLCSKYFLDASKRHGNK